MKKGLFTLLLLIMTVLPALAAPGNTSGPWGVDAGAFKNLSSALASPNTINKTVVISKPMPINNKTLPADRHIKFVRGGRIEPSAGKVFDFNGQNPEKGQYRIYGGAGTIIGLNEAAPEAFVENTTPGVTDMTAAIQSAATAGKELNMFGSTRYKISGTVNITTSGQLIRGPNKGRNLAFVVAIESDQDIEFFRVTGHYVRFEGLWFICTSNTHSKKHIQAQNVDHLDIVNCRFDGNDVTNTGSATGGGVGFGDGSGGVGGSMGLVDNCIFSNASIDILTWDVKISNTWVWAISRPWGIMAQGSIGNTTIISTDIVPPYYDVPNIKAGIWFSGAITQPVLMGVYIDGNPSLNLGIGILMENGVLNPVITGLRANQNDSDTIVLDSVIGPVVSSSTFLNGNQQRNGASDIVIQKNYTQPIEKPIIEGNTFTQTGLALSGTPGYAVKVAAGATRRQIKIINNSIHQQSSGTGYQNIEIGLMDGAFTSISEGSLAGNAGTMTHYHNDGIISLLSTDTYKTSSYLYSLAYPPRPDQFNFNYASTGSPPNIRFNIGSLPAVSNFGLGLSGTFNNGVLYYSVSL